MKKHDQNTADSNLGEETDHDDYKYTYVFPSLIVRPKGCTVLGEETLCLKANAQLQLEMPHFTTSLTASEVKSLTLVPLSVFQEKNTCKHLQSQFSKS